jgi:DNA-binding beta-propeller fold protein YncE
MVQHFLNPSFRSKLPKALVIAYSVLLMLMPPAASAGSKSISEPDAGPEVLLDARGTDRQRKLSYERSFSSEREVRIKRGFWTRLVDIVAGEPEFHSLVRPYSVVTDSHGRVIVSDPGAFGIHIFDFAQQKYKFISRYKEKDGLHSPQCVAVDDADNIYVTDAEAGKIFVFDAKGKFQRVIGSLKGGEGFFKRPTGIAVDSPAQKIFVTDTLRNKIFVLDMQGSILNTIGKSGSGNGEFNFPTELRFRGQDLIVVDAMNFRIQVLDRSGGFRYAIGRAGDARGEFFRPKGVALDSEGHIYVVEGLSAMIQVFDPEGSLLYYFGQKGTGPGEFQLPAGLSIDRNDRVYVVDSYNRRVQVFHYFGFSKQAEGATN